MLLPIIFLVLLIGGAALAAQSSINGRLGANVGVLESAWLTFVSGALITFLLMFFFEPAHQETLFTVPKWQLIGALFGVVYMLVIVFAVPRVGTAAATVATISGQLLMSVLIDNFGWLGNAHMPLDASRYTALALLAGALVLIYLSNTRRRVGQAKAAAAG
ncbi:DMT family transporter [Chromohalobacter canadensis]|uniref:DMT family transporter n=1 Tax=Chromohalobacter canadensis TaxID=141389 RepID=A0A285VM92_9GAMM|nr:DMT family transporter [Chromohalobacter canadensis]MCK0769799.1 DMT family transporter [Chromohalobacter canadensis]MCT8467294.1 DMT family transporter [Chromohalobacter canadensis]MCT8470958.1 DMT family transporter [Chromohalobacter canadensis]MCT8497791.1 DMT family transporter [Chromohalobacter canadensis]WQH08107.1 DMT family transporter [Chromohalobacter canadensis]